MDLAGEQFWDKFWKQQHGRRFAGASHFHRRMSHIFEAYVAPGAEVCEIGCGGSTWLPLLVKRGARAWGIDYSEQALVLARANLARAGTTATLIHADVRNRQALPAGTFDLVFSAGFIEHFDDPETVLRAIARSLRPTGVLVTLVPNFAGWWGNVQRRIDPELFAVHRVYSCEGLDALHAAAGLKPVERAHFFGGFGPLVVNYSRRLETWPRLARTLWIWGLWGIQQMLAWSLAAARRRDGARYSSHILGAYCLTQGGFAPVENPSAAGIEPACAE